MGASVVTSLVVSHQSHQNIISISSLLVVDTDALPSVKCKLSFSSTWEKQVQLSRKTWAVKLS